jgi:hypothetical protein
LGRVTRKSGLLNPIATRWRITGSGNWNTANRRAPGQGVLQRALMDVRHVMAEGIIVTNPMLPEPLFPYGLFTAPYACGEGDEAEMSGKSHRRQLRGIFLNSVIPGLDPGMTERLQPSAGSLFGAFSSLARQTQSERLPTKPSGCQPSGRSRPISLTEKPTLPYVVTWNCGSLIL